MKITFGIWVQFERLYIENAQVFLARRRGTSKFTMTIFLQQRINTTNKEKAFLITRVWVYHLF